MKFGFLKSFLQPGRPFGRTQS